VGACGYIMSCLALNGTASRGSDSNGAYPVPKNPRAWLPGAWVRAKPGTRSYSGLTGGEILLARGHRDERKDRCKSG
jgi:hypothetical protein